MTETKEISIVQQANQELVRETKDPATMRALMATTFKGFKSEQLVKQACLEAMINGYTFKDLIQKKVYAIPFGDGYSLVQSIDDIRVTAMRSGQAGKDAPVYVMNGQIIESCSVTVYRIVQGVRVPFTATVFFEEYNKGRDNWKTKPRTMIAKVAEMHALRMAFPEELAKAYIEDEFNEKEGIMSDRLEGAIENGRALTMGNLIKNNDKNKKEGGEEDQSANGPTDAEGTQERPESEPSIR